MSRLLNPELYDLLQTVFGEVTVRHAGVPMDGYFEPDLDRPGQDRFKVSGWGECYYVDCFKCGDSKQRLLISHRWGQRDPATGSLNLGWCRCLNEESCMSERENRQQLYEMVYIEAPLGIHGHVACGSQRIRGVPARRFEGVELPGLLMPLKGLSEDHPARLYLRGRGFDPDHLSEHWGVCYCAEAKPSFGTATNRLFIPIHRDGKLFGWQARYLGDVIPDGVIKYYTLGGMKKSDVLYNGDRARRNRHVVLVEGPTDVWAYGDEAVCTFGAQVAPEQRNLLVSGWGDGLIVVMQDPDAATLTDDLVSRLRPLVQHLVRVRLPDGCDPGSYEPGELRQLVHEACQRAGKPLEAFGRRDESDLLSTRGPASPARTRLRAGGNSL